MCMDWERSFVRDLAAKLPKPPMLTFAPSPDGRAKTRPWKPLRQRSSGSTRSSNNWKVESPGSKLDSRSRCRRQPHPLRRTLRWQPSRLLRRVNRCAPRPPPRVPPPSNLSNRQQSPSPPHLATLSNPPTSADPLPRRRLVTQQLPLPSQDQHLRSTASTRSLLPPSPPPRASRPSPRRSRASSTSSSTSSKTDDSFSAPRNLSLPTTLPLHRTLTSINIMVSYPADRQQAAHWPVEEERAVKAEWGQAPNPPYGTDGQQGRIVYHHQGQQQRWQQ